MGLKIEPIAFKKSLSNMDNVLKEIFPKLDPAYRNMMKSSNSMQAYVSNPLHKTISTNAMQQEIKMKNLEADKFIKAKMP